jgi:hypothetical protein
MAEEERAKLVAVLVPASAAPQNKYINASSLVRAHARAPEYTANVEYIQASKYRPVVLSKMSPAREEKCALLAQIQIPWILVTTADSYRWPWATGCPTVDPPRRSLSPLQKYQQHSLAWRRQEGQTRGATPPGVPQVSGRNGAAAQNCVNELAVSHVVSVKKPAIAAEKRGESLPEGMDVV